jgi:transposase
VDDRALYATILGLTEPWDVDRVELRPEEKAVHIWVLERTGSRFTCPECGAAAPVYDHVERQWRHLDTCQFTTQLHAAVPRIECSSHGVKTIPVPWAERHSHFTLLFERLAIAWLREATPLAVARRLGLSWEQTNGIVERAVRRGLLRRSSAAAARIGIDEHSYLKPHQYVTMVVDLDRRIVLDVADDRRQETLEPYFQRLTPEERAGITAIAMDMWDPYLKTIRAWVPNAAQKVVFDKFHVMRMAAFAVDQVRAREQKALRARGDRRLTGTKYWWLKNPANLDRLSTAARYQFAALKRSSLKAARAWALKESFRKLWEYRSIPAARAFVKQWLRWAKRSRLRAIVYFAGIIERRLENILTYLTHHVTNAVSEGLNAKIQWIKYSSRGFRNRDRFKLAIMFHLGGLDLEPRT